MCPNAWFTGKRRARTRWLRILCLLIAICTMFPIRTYAVTLQDLYNFNSTYGDSKTTESDDGGSGQINLTVSFPFFNKKHDKLYVNNNGVISFLKELTVYRPDDFPLKDSTPIIAPFWADVDVTEGGQVWYREDTNPLTLNIATKEVQSYYPKARKFKATWMFVATWDRVCFYGASGAGENKTNTFQAILITNGKESFVIFNYQRIDWTTGTNSGGDTTTGLGGNPAQAGFNAGDQKTYYEIDGARKDTVINLTLSSNVNIPGKWFFKVDSAQIQGRCSNTGRPQSQLSSFRERKYKRSVASICPKTPTEGEGSGSLHLSPSSGSMLGQNVVNVTDPCFTLNDVLLARIDNKNQTFPCKVIDNAIASCKFPAIFRTGKLDFSLNINSTGWNYTGTYYVENLIFNKPAIKRENADQWIFGKNENAVKITGPTSQVPSEDVFIALYSYDNGKLVEVEKNATKLRIHGSKFEYKYLLPTINGSLVVLRIFSKNDSDLRESIWSDVFPVKKSEEDFSEKQCNKWLERESKLPMITDREPCPCTFGQAQGDTGRYQPYPLCHEQSYDSTCIYNQPEARNCIIQNYQGSQSNSEICCYDKDGELLNALSNTGGGTSTRYHYLSQGDNIVPYFTFLQEDLLPSLHCCQYTSNDTLCKLYHELRKPTTCQGYDPPAAAQAAGDPHIVTLDGKAYTFNGIGEFVLVEDKDKTVIVQVQAQQAKDIDGKLQKATIFNAVAMQVTNVSDKIEIKWFEEEPVQVLVNGQESQLPATSQLNGLTVYKNETSSNETEFTVVMDSIGMSVLVVATPDLLNIMIIVGSYSLKGNLEGLLGNYNGDMSDDFVNRDGIRLPASANMSDIHYNFGMTWSVSGNESLFSKEVDSIVNSVNSVQSDNNTKFVPDFIDTVTKNVSKDVKDICVDNVQCIYDFDQTGKVSIAQSTKAFRKRFDELKNKTQKVVRCPYVREIPNGNRTVTGYKVASIVTFNCNEGYIITQQVSTVTRFCQKYGNWSGIIPDCIISTVPDNAIPDWLYYAAIALGTVGGFTILIVIVFLVIRQVSKKHPYRKTIKESDSEGIVELPEIFTPSPSNIPEPVFKNRSFLESLEKLSSGTDRFRIPRPDYVDPNIYSEYF